MQSSCVPESKLSSRCLVKMQTNSENLNYYVLVETYTQAMAIQEKMREEQVPSRISPTPHSIQGIVGCGVAILLLPENLEAARACLDKYGLTYHSIVPLPCQINPRRDKFA